MRYLHYDLGAGPQDVIEVTLGRAASILLLDTANYEHFRARERYEFCGGYVTVSPYHFLLPRQGRWHIMIGRRGRNGTVPATVRLLPGLIEQATARAG